MKKNFVGLVVVVSTFFLFSGISLAADKGLHLGSVDKSAREAQIETKKAMQKADRNMKKIEKQTDANARKAAKQAEKDMNKMKKVYSK